MNPRVRSILTDVVLGLSIMAIHLLSRYLTGANVSFILTSLSAFWVGFLRPGSSQANAFPQWMLLNFWFFIYVPLIGKGSSLPVMFLLASYGASALGFLTSVITSKLPRSFSVGVTIALSLGLVALAWWAGNNNLFLDAGA